MYLNIDNRNALKSTYINQKIFTIINKLAQSNPNLE